MLFTANIWCQWCMEHWWNVSERAGLKNLGPVVHHKQNGHATTRATVARERQLTTWAMAQSWLEIQSLYAVLTYHHLWCSSPSQTCIGILNNRLLQPQSANSYHQLQFHSDALHNYHLYAARQMWPYLQCVELLMSVENRVWKYLTSLWDDDQKMDFLKHPWM